jgi:AcrR family transcriptional regulator
VTSEIHPHPREAIAERNLEAILDSAEQLLHRGEQPSISAVAGEAGVSRPTVYAHFPDRQALLAALVERTVNRVMATIESTDPARGPADEAMQRLIAASWEQVARHEDIGRAAAAELGAGAMRTAHESARSVIREMIERGRQDGSFRTDLPTDWLVTSTLALIHAAAESVREGEIEPDAAPGALRATVAGLLAGQRKRATRRRV